MDYRGDSRCGQNGIHPTILPGPGDYRTDDPEGESLGFGMLEGCDGYTGSVFLTVIFSDQL